MISTWLLILLALPLVYFLQSCWCLRRNIATAKATGLPYVVLPWSNLNLPWLILRPFIQPYLRFLPVQDKLWFKLLNVDWPWLEQYSIFQQLGCDSFILVSSAKNSFNTADAAVIDQITKRRTDFPKPVEVYGSLELYGKNVVSTEGNLWKHHRKTVSPPFNEKNNRLVWLESLRQAQGMLGGWMGDDSKAPSVVHTVATDCMRLSLHVISCAGFGVNLNWPGSEDDSPQKALNGSTPPMPEKTSEDPQFGPDHNMSYTEALHTLLHSMVWILVLPTFLLKTLPFKRTKTAYNAYIEWGKYLHEIFNNKKNAIISGQVQAKDDGMDLMGFLLRGANITPSTSSTSSQKTPTSSSKQQPPLSDTEIMGNAFLFLLAGHETAANSIHFSLVYLAMHPRSQRRLQASLDHIFGSRPISAWDYERDFTALFSSLTGAVLAEELRLVPPVPAIPKCVPSNSPPQPLLINDKEYHIQPATYINLISTAAHRNPKTWPAGKPRDDADGPPVHPTSNIDNDLEEFKPERWLRDTTASDASASSDPEHAFVHTEDAPSTSTGTSSSSAHHRPPRGAYVPFSEGFRACLGRRFAQVEVLAVLAVIFRTCSVELGVDAHASEEQVEGMGEAERRKVWGTVKAEVEALMREKMTMLFTMQLREGKVGLRVCRRGEERFPF
ncbi:MAG: hypothetical protein LQ344_005048 [Seirophora lacunosa]|nr:MAG: hypothetical protein LQ344_005048 [Seirophora lacunosa]